MRPPSGMVFATSCVSVATAIVGITGLALAYLLAKRKFLGKELLDAALTMPLVLPPTVTGYYLIVLLGRHGIIGEYFYTYWVNENIVFMITLILLLIDLSTIWIGGKKLPLHDILINTKVIDV